MENLLLPTKYFVVAIATIFGLISPISQEVSPVVEGVSTSTQTVQATITPTLKPTSTPTPTPITKKIRVYPTNTPYPTATPYPTTVSYRIYSLPELVNLNGTNSESIQAAQFAYSIFLQTPNLSSLNFEQQSNILRPLIESEIQKVLDEKKEKLQNQIDSLDNQNTQYQYVPSVQNQADNSLQECIDNKIASINSNPYLSESSRQAQIANAPYWCASQN